MPFASTTLGAEQPLITSELLGYGRDPLAPIKDAVTADGDVVVPIDAEAFGFWLKAAFGEPTTTGSRPRTHEFRSGGWTLPSLSIETAMPEVPRFAMYSGCVLDQLSWQLQRSGLLTATARLVAQGETVATTTAAGTPAELALKRFGHFNGSITRNGSALGNVVSAEITYANNLDRIETIRSDGRIDGADPSIAALTGRVEVRFADQVLVNQAIAGDPCELEFAYALPSGESLTFTVHAVYLPRPRIEISGRRACRRPSTGRRRGTPRSGACAVACTPPPSSTTSRSIDPMLRLDLTSEPRWLDLGHGVRLRRRPLTTALMVASRSDPAVEALPESASDEERALVFAKAIARRAVAEWEGVGDADGNPVPVTPVGIDALLEVWPIFEAFQAVYVSKGLLLDAQKNASAPSPTGTSAGRPLLRGLRPSVPGLPGAAEPPETFEGWQVWDLALRLGGQLRVIPGAVIGWDMGAALSLATALGIDPMAAAELLPEIEAVMVRRLNEAIGDSQFRPEHTLPR